MPHPVESSTKHHNPSHSTSSFFLLILYALNVILWHIRVLLQDPIENVVAQIALNGNLLATARRLGDARTGGKLLAHVLGEFFQLEAVRLEPGDGRNVLALGALDALDLHHGACLGLLGSRLRGLGLGCLLGGVLFGTLLRIDRQGGE